MAQKEIHGGADDREVAGGRTPVQPRQHDCRDSQAGRDDRANLLPLTEGSKKDECGRRRTGFTNSLVGTKTGADRCEKLLPHYATNSALIMRFKCFSREQMFFSAVK